MALIGSIIKKGLALASEIELRKSSGLQQQKEELRKLLEGAKDTSFGKFYNFEGILSDEDPYLSYKERVPIHTYEQLNERWWKQQQNFPDITWPGKPEYFALTSGTSGSESKRIPVTKDFTNSLRAVATEQLLTLADMDLPEPIFESEVLGISSSADLSQENGHLEGEISGINVNNFPSWYDLFYRPGKEIASINDWDERVARIVEEAPKWNIGVISGIPSWVQLCLKKIIEVHELEYIDDLWPNVTLFLSGGVAFETYNESFRSLFRKDIIVVDTYLASEGFFAYGVPSENLEMKLATSHGYYFEFIPFDNRGFDKYGNLLEDPKVLNLAQVEKDTEYALVVSSRAGAWRYLIGDTIKFTELSEARIKITGRTKFWLNVVGSQLSEQKLDAAIQHIKTYYNLDINEYSVSCIQEEDEKYYHHWVLISNDKLNVAEARQKLDDYLKKSNNNYKVARNKALAGLRLHQMEKASYGRWLEQKKKLGGQVKIQKVMNDDDMKDLLEFIYSD